MFPLAAIAFLIYTIYKNVQGVAFPYDRFPFWVAGWLVIGLAFILFAPAVARRIGEALTRDAGLGDAET
ncbi:MAG: hypothetical protein JO027_16895 [Solirubrobacterales bacterium]|nr:hypothetical protein [Solirubrobacterales bacterium]